jgi:hypothetical protein
MPKSEKVLKFNLDNNTTNTNNNDEQDKADHRRRFNTFRSVKTATSLPTKKKMTHNNAPYSLNLGLNYTCHRLGDGNDRNKNIVRSNYCGECNSCEIVARLSNLKPWFDRASHISQKKLLLGLLARIQSPKAYVYLSDVLKPLFAYSKDFIYARNKYLPSLDEDAVKVTNNRCVTKRF